MTNGEKWHVFRGRPAIRIPDTGHEDLENNVPLWRALWTGNREMLLADWIERNPGSRPPAFYKFDGEGLPERDDEEPEVFYLDRCDLIGPAEMEAITQSAIRLVRANGSSKPGDRNFIPDMNDHLAFALDHGLLAGKGG